VGLYIRDAEDTIPTYTDSVDSLNVRVDAAHASTRSIWDSASSSSPATPAQELAEHLHSSKQTQYRVHSYSYVILSHVGTVHLLSWQCLAEERLVIDCFLERVST
jgi:hypothetical protein